MEVFFGTAGLFLAGYRYPLVFLAVLVQGPVIMMGSGILLRLGEFSFLPLYFTLLIADLVGDIIWYFIGRNAAEPFLRRFGYTFGVTREVFLKMGDVFRRHDIKILFISKITMGFGFALTTLMAAGAARVPFKKYLLLNFLGGFIWTGFLLALGFFFGHLYSFVADGFEVAFIGATVVILIAIFYGLMSFIRRKYISKL